MTTPATQNSPAPLPNSKAAVAALIFSILGLCIFPFALVGIVLGIIGIINTSPTHEPRLGGRIYAVVSLCMAPFLIFSVGILAAIAIPNFIKFQEKAKMSEAKTNLKAICVAAKSYQGEKNELPASIPETPASIPCGQTAHATPEMFGAWRTMGFLPESTIRYRYSFTRSPDGRSFTADARAELSCNGKESHFTLDGDTCKVTESAAESL